MEPNVVEIELENAASDAGSADSGDVGLVAGSDVDGEYAMRLDTLRLEIESRVVGWLSVEDGKVMLNDVVKAADNDA